MANTLRAAIIEFCNQFLPSPEPSLFWAIGGVIAIYGLPAALVIALCLAFEVTPGRVARGIRRRVRAGEGRIHAAIVLLVFIFCGSCLVVGTMFSVVLRPVIEALP